MGHSRTPGPGATRPAAGATSRAGPLALLLVCLIVGAFLRLDALDARAFSPDEGSYLYSAGIHRIDRDSHAGAWIGEDLEWWGRDKEYPHSYLHQLLARYVYRLSGSCKEAIRLGSVLFGLLTGAVLFVFYSRSFPEKRWVGAYAGGLVALMCLHTWYSRTGWGTTSCTFFYAIYFTLAWRVFQVTTVRGVALGTLALGLSALAAYGFHEMMSVYVVGMGLYVLVRALDTGPDTAPWPVAYARRLVRSPATWAYVLSAVPVGLLTLNILRGSEFAQEHWFVSAHEDSGYWSWKLKTLTYLFRDQGGLGVQISYTVLALAAGGALHLFRTDRRYFAFVVVNLVGSFLLFVFFFRDVNLIRIHLPSALLIGLLAAEAVVALVTWAAARGQLARTLALVGAGGLLVYLPLVTRATIFGRSEDLFFQANYRTSEDFLPLSEAKAKEVLFADYLRENLREGDLVASIGYTPLFILLDGGIHAVLFGRGRGTYVMGLSSEVPKRLSRRFGVGRYEEVVSDPDSRWSLYRKKRP